MTEADKLAAAAKMFVGAVERLGKSPPGRKDSYFEAPLSAEGAIQRWQELDAAGKQLRQTLREYEQRKK